MKKLITLILAALLVFALASCGGDNNDDKKPDGGGSTDETKFSALVYDGSIDLMSVSNELLKANGKNIPIKMTSSEQSGAEICFGNTDREVSVDALAALEALCEENGEDKFGYLIYKSREGSVAVVWSNQKYMSKEAVSRFLESFSDLEALYNRPYGVLANQFFEIAPYIEETSWADIEASASDEVVAALKSLKEYFNGPAIADWMSYLYDPYICVCGKCAKEGKEIACYGAGFYFSNSARDYEPFLPDAESTVQLLRWLDRNGAFENYKDYTEALPDDIKAKLLKYGQSLQDPDGYFYHPQWGKNISISRKGRDLGWGLEIIRKMGGEPLYDSPNASAPSDEPVAKHLTSPLGSSVVMPVSATDDFEASLKSEESYLEWLYEVTADIKINSAGSHTVASAWKQIKAAGYADITYEYYDRIQTEVYEEMKAAYEADPVNNPEPTGAFQYTADYKAVWGLLKLNSVFGDTKHSYKYHTEKVKTCIAAIKLDAETGGSYAMNDLYNMWTSINLVITNAKRYEPQIVDSLYALMQEGTASMIEETIKKISAFRCEDGGFSYTVTYAPPAMYGAPTALGIKESDVNATALACSMYRFIFEVLGYEPVSLCNFTDGERFLETIAAAEPIEKIVTVKNEPMTYDEEPANLTEKFVSSGYSAIVEDPKDKTNNVLKYSTLPGDSGDALRFSAFDEGDNAHCYVFDTDMMVESGNRAVLYQFRIACDEKSNVVYMFEVILDDGKIMIAENPTTSSTTHRNMIGEAAALGEWFNIRIEYYSNLTTPKIKIYINDVLVAVTSTFYGSQNEGASPRVGYNHASLFAPKATEAVSYFDNSYFAKIVKEYVEETPEG